MSTKRAKRVSALLTAVLAIGAVQFIGAPAAQAASSQISTGVAGSLSASVDSAFPRVLEYSLGGGTLKGDPGSSTEVRINGTAYTPTVTSSPSSSKVEYTLSLPSIQVTIKLTIAVTDDNILDFKVTEIAEAGTTKVQTFELPGQPVVSARSDMPNSALARGVASGHPSGVNDVFSSVANAPVDASPVAAAIAVVSNTQLAAAVSSNAIQSVGNLLVQTTQQGAVKQTGVRSNVWTYRGPDGKVVDLPRQRVIITGDANADAWVGWQDGVVAFRKIMTKPFGGGDVSKNVVQQIAMNFASQAENPFLRTLDDIKKLNLLTDGLNQTIQLKGFAGQGHDSAHPDYAGHYNVGAGGLADLKKLTKAAKDYNAIVGVHINGGAQELPAKAFRWKKNKAGSTAPCYVWGEAQYCMDDAAERSGPYQERLSALISEVPDLGFVYSDAMLTSDWPSYVEPKAVNGYNIPIHTEWSPSMFPYATWYHAAVDPNHGLPSQMLRFAYNSQMDAWPQGHALLGGQSIDKNFLGYHNDGNLNTSIKEIFSTSLWTKWLQNFEVLRWTDDEIRFTGNVVSKMNGTTPQILQNDVLLRDGGAMFLPWDPQAQSKIYAWTPTAGSRTWTLPSTWSTVTQAALYKLTDTGAVNVASLPVNSGKQVTLTLEANTPYVVYPASKPAPSATAASVNFGEGAIVKDGNFYSKSFDSWTRASTSGDTTGITIDTDAKGFQNLTISGANDGEVTQQLTGLQANKTYVLSAYVSVVGSRTATLKVDGIGGAAVSKSITAPPPSQIAATNRLVGMNFQRMQVVFTPTGTTATVRLQGGATVSTGDKVLFNGVRVQQVDGATETTSGHMLTEDFEHLALGWGPFVTMNSDPSMWLAEKNEGYTRNTISGNFSLNTVYSGFGIQGARTWPGTVAFVSGRTYRVRLDYQADTADAFKFRAQGAAGTFADLPLARTTDRSLNSAPPAGPIPAGWDDTLPPQESAPHASLDFTFVANGNDNYLSWVQLPGAGGSASIDNLVIDDLGVVPGGLAIGDIVTLTSTSSGQNANVLNASDVDGATVSQRSAVPGATNEQFRIGAGTTAGTYTFAAVHSGKCLNITGGSAANGAKAIQWPCQGAANGQFQLRSSTGGGFQLVAAHSGRCLTVPDFSTTAGTPLDQYECQNSANQSWRLTKVG